jgi:hypothetical protein
MKGITLQTDTNGLAVITIDRANLDPAVSPLVTGLLHLLAQQSDGPDYEFAATFEEERAEFLYASALNLNRAYGDDEPEYTDADIKEHNPNYRPQ